jgi:WD40 repeat protein
VEALRGVRTFRGHGDRITDLGIAADGRWLLSASLDGSLRVWDVPSARCLQARAVGALALAVPLGPCSHHSHYKSNAAHGRLGRYLLLMRRPVACMQRCLMHEFQSLP